MLGLVVLGLPVKIIWSPNSNDTSSVFPVFAFLMINFDPIMGCVGSKLGFRVRVGTNLVGRMNRLLR